MKLNNTVRVEVNAIVQNFEKITMCLSLSKPKRLDGHNFGVQVQTEVRKILQGIPIFCSFALILNLDVSSRYDYRLQPFRRQMEHPPRWNTSQLAIWRDL